MLRKRCTIRTFDSLSEFRTAVGEDLGTSDWLVVDQSMITQFAELTGDVQWIHVDVVRAREAPLGSTIAHGFLTLSLIPAFIAGVYEVKSLSMGMNYGLNRVRFPAPLRAGSRIRATVQLTAYDGDDSEGTATLTIAIQDENSDRPVCVAEMLARLAA